jgi:hypothetical protein
VSTTTHWSRSPDTERTVSNIPAEVTSWYCVSDPITMVAGRAVERDDCALAGVVEQDEGARGRGIGTEAVIGIDAAPAGFG